MKHFTLILHTFFTRSVNSRVCDKIFAGNSSREKAGFWGHANPAQAETFRHKPSLVWTTEANVDHHLSVLQSHENCRMSVHLKITRNLSLKVNTVKILRKKDNFGLRCKPCVLELPRVQGHFFIIHCTTAMSRETRTRRLYALCNPSKRNANSVQNVSLIQHKFVRAMVVFWRSTVELKHLRPTAHFETL